MTDKENPTFVERFTVRMPDGLRDAIAERAKSNGRSMNSEIVQILEDALNESRVKEVYIDMGNDGQITIDTSDIDTFVIGLKAFAEAVKKGRLK